MFPGKRTNLGDFSIIGEMGFGCDYRVSWTASGSHKWDGTESGTNRKRVSEMNLGCGLWLFERGRGFTVEFAGRKFSAFLKCVLLLIVDEEGVFFVERKYA